MAQAAWRRPALGLSSWSCMGPRCQVMVDARSNCTEEENSSKYSAFAIEESSEPLLSSRKGMHGDAVQNKDSPVPSSVGECSCISKMNSDAEGDVDINDGDQMNDAELWQQLKHELRDRTEGEEAAVENEIREEEVEAMEEETNSETLSSASKVKEVHRFFPPGRIMHIVTLSSSPTKCENEAGPISSSSDKSQPDETKIGIFLTSRSLYSKVRLSQTMISDHFMPVYIRQIERLIKELEMEEDHRTSEVVL